MKSALLVSIALLLSFSAFAQPDLDSLQQNWIKNINEGELTSSANWEKGYLLYEDGKVKKPGALPLISEKEGFAKIKKYRQTNVFKHDDNRYVTTGVMATDEKNVLLLSGWRNTDEGWKREIDVILILQPVNNVPFKRIMTELEAERNKWMELANAHDPAAHISHSYSSDAVYLSNGRRSVGHTNITRRYAYMKNPDYHVKLEKKYLRQVSSSNVLEIGRYYAGQRDNNPGGLYMILWQKNGEGDWKIGLDFNF